MSCFGDLLIIRFLSRDCCFLLSPGAVCLCCCSDGMLLLEYLLADCAALAAVLCVELVDCAAPADLLCCHIIHAAVCILMLMELVVLHTVFKCSYYSLLCIALDFCYCILFF